MPSTEPQMDRMSPIRRFSRYFQLFTHFSQEAFVEMTSLKPWLHRNLSEAYPAHITFHT
uniref:Uncharacterized protein n=1 Tax=Anguilla anguilla TaxID=7936 RepID=A0A0E9S8M5_ANGAN